jgi:hypothetical protein
MERTVDRTALEGRPDNGVEPELSPECKAKMQQARAGKGK